MLGTGGVVAAAIALPSFDRLLGFLWPSPIGLRLIAGTSVSAVLLGRLPPDVLGARKFAGLLPEAKLSVG